MEAQQIVAVELGGLFCNMDKMSWISVVSVSIPESFLIILSILAIVRANYRVLANMHKIVFAAVASACLLSLGRAFNGSLITNVLMMYIIIIALYSFVLKMEWYKISFSLFLSVFAFGIIELIVVGVSVTIFQIEVSEVQGSDFLRFVLSVPVRIVEVAGIIFLNRLPKPVIEIRPITMTLGLVKKILVVHVFFLLCVLKLFITIKFYIWDLSLAERQRHFNYLIQDILFLIITLGIAFYISSKFMKMIDNKNNNKNNALLLVRSLLEKKSNDTITEEALKIIDNSIDER